MNSPAASDEGGCRCGQVRFKVSGTPLLTAACHCRGCQRMTASAFSLSAAYREVSFAVIAGEPAIGGLHGASRHFFCPHCMSWMFTRPEGMDGFVNVRVTLFDQPDQAPPFIEFFRKDGLPWAETGAVHSFETEPEDARFPALFAEYADTIAKEAP